jgi:hypothetical protein
VIEDAILRRYQNDAYFHGLVNGLVACMDQANMSSHSILAATLLAIELKAQRDLKRRLRELK